MSWRTGRRASEFYAAEYDALRREKARAQEEDRVPARPLDPAHQNWRRKRLHRDRLAMRAVNNPTSEGDPMSKAAVKRFKEQEQQRELHAKLESATARKPVAELAPDEIDPVLAALSPEEQAVEVARREQEKASMLLRARRYGQDFVVAEPAAAVSERRAPTEPVEVQEQNPVTALSVAEVEAQMRAEEQRLAEQIADLEEQSKRRLIELAMQRAEAENAKEARKAVDVDAALAAFTKTVQAPKRDLAAEQLAQARARFDERARPYKQELAAATKALADFEERYGARLDALGKVEREAWLNGQPSDGKHQQASLAVTHQLMMALEQLNRLRDELPRTFRQFRDELKMLRDWAGVERPPYGSAQHFGAACGQILGTGATHSINQGNLRMAVSVVPTLQGRVDHIVQILAVVTERQKAGAPPIEFEVPPARRGEPTRSPRELGQTNYLDNSPSVFERR
jgi:hypothetical protein